MSIVGAQLQGDDNQVDKIIAPARTQFDFQSQDIRNSILTQISWTHTTAQFFHGAKPKKNGNSICVASEKF